jgi:lysophospholipase L1-like esterase
MISLMKSIYDTLEKHMKCKTAVLLGAILIGLWCFPGSGKQVYAEETLPGGAAGMTESNTANMFAFPAYLTIKEDTQVYAVPGAVSTALGVLHAGQPAIAVDRTENGWLYIYYIGMPAYIPESTVEGYKIPEQVPWQNMELQENMKINVLGDSFTYGDKLSDTTWAFPNVISAKCGAAVLNKYGLNGSCVAGMNPGKLLDRYPGMERDADLILVLGGTNDYGGAAREGTELGLPGDLTGGTFYGGLNLMMCGLKQMYPDKEIVFMTPTRRWGYTRKNKNGYTLGQYAEAIRERAAFWGIRVIDLYNEPGLDFAGAQAGYLVDGLHPNRTGHALLGDCVYRRLFENM